MDPLFVPFVLFAGTHNANNEDHQITPFNEYILFHFHLPKGAREGLSDGLTANFCSVYFDFLTKNRDKRCTDRPATENKVVVI